MKNDTPYIITLGAWDSSRADSEENQLKFKEARRQIMRELPALQIWGRNFVLDAKYLSKIRAAIRTVESITQELWGLGPAQVLESSPDFTFGEISSYLRCPCCGEDNGSDMRRCYRCGQVLQPALDKPQEANHDDSDS